MIVKYDDEVDAVYLQLSEAVPDGVVENAEGVNLDTTADGKIAGIEILSASLKIDIKTLLTYRLKLDGTARCSRACRSGNKYAAPRARPPGGGRTQGRAGSHDREIRSLGQTF